MIMKKIIVLWIAFCLSLAGCTSSRTDSNENTALTDDKNSVVAEKDAVDTELAEEARTISPLPDMSMENLTDTILSVSLDEGNAYVDDHGRMQMDLTIYSYDQYDMVDIANLKVSDTLVRHDGEVKVASKEQHEAGTIYINGGLDNGGFNLITDDCGTFYEMGFNDTKNWYPVGEATIRVSADFKGIDRADLELGEVIIYPGDFLIGAVTNYDFTPYNTTIRIENGQIIEMNRRFIP